MDEAARRLAAGGPNEVPHLRLAAGDIVPADARLLRAEAWWTAG